MIQRIQTVYMFVACAVCVICLCSEVGRFMSEGAQVAGFSNFTFTPAGTVGTVCIADNVCASKSFCHHAVPKKIAPVEDSDFQFNIPCRLYLGICCFCVCVLQQDAACRCRRFVICASCGSVQSDYSTYPQLSSDTRYTQG